MIIFCLFVWCIHGAPTLCICGDLSMSRGGCVPFPITVSNSMLVWLSVFDWVCILWLDIGSCAIVWLNNYILGQWQVVWLREVVGFIFCCVWLCVCLVLAVCMTILLCVCERLCAARFHAFVSEAHLCLTGLCDCIFYSLVTTYLGISVCLFGVN